MTGFFIALSIITFFVVVTNLSTRLNDNYFTEQQLNQITRGRNISIIIGLINIGFAILNYFCWEKTWSPVLCVFIGFFMGFSYLMLILSGIGIPSRESIIREEKEKMKNITVNKFIEANKLDNIIDTGEIFFAISKQFSNILVYQLENDGINVWRVINFDEIIGCDLIEDNTTVMQGGIGRAVVGGVLAGGIGAVVGAQTRKSSNIVEKLNVRILTNNIDEPICNICIIYTQTDRSSDVYKQKYSVAEKIYATVNAIINSK